ncbi:MAG: hypothetical protein V1837_02290 [Candidatus Woesearchaeota archaeon]
MVKIRKEVIDFHTEEIPLMINKLYNALNKSSKCHICKARAPYIRVVVNNNTKVRVYRICGKCLNKYSIS